jgi:uncharacterized protein
MNRVIHFEIHASDTAKMAEFYTAVFGWECRKWDNPVMDYWIVMTAPDGSSEPGINGGITGRKGPAPAGGEPVDAFVCTIGVPNVDEYIKKVVEAGGKNVVPKAAIPGLAWLAYCTDIEGNIFGIYEDDKNAK